MNLKYSILARILESGAIGIVRSRKEIDLVKTVDALRAGGLQCIEITVGTPGALEAISLLSQRDILIGAGTVLDSETATLALNAGARFLITPTLSIDVAQTARQKGAAVILGAYTPTEILEAWADGGADLVKVFPAASLGPEYFRALRGPLPQIPLAAVGGITAQNAAEYLLSGAAVVCSGSVADPKVAEEGAYDKLTQNARELVSAVISARKERTR